MRTRDTRDGLRLDLDRSALAHGDCGSHDLVHRQLDSVRPRGRLAATRCGCTPRSRSRAYVLLWARIVWRFKQGHPGADAGADGASSTRSASTRTTRCSPPIVCDADLRAADGLGARRANPRIRLVHDPGAVRHEHGAVRRSCTRIHVWCSRIIIVGTVLHLGGVYKHAAFNQDGTFGKMLVAARKD